MEPLGVEPGDVLDDRELELRDRFPDAVADQFGLEAVDEALGERVVKRVADLDRSHPGAAGSLREGLEETLTLTRLGIGGSLKRTLESTNPCESMIECVRRTSRNVKRWSSGEMAKCWTAAGMLEAEKQFRKMIGYRDLAKLAIAIEHDLARTTVPSPTQEAAILIST